MPAYSERDEAMAAKILCFYPENKDVPAHIAQILLFNPRNGLLQAVSISDADIYYLLVCVWGGGGGGGLRVRGFTHMAIIHINYMRDVYE